MVSFHLFSCFLFFNLFKLYSIYFIDLQFRQAFSISKNFNLFRSYFFFEITNWIIAFGFEAKSQQNKKNCMKKVVSLWYFYRNRSSYLLSKMFQRRTNWFVHELQMYTQTINDFPYLENTKYAKSSYKIKTYTVALNWKYFFKKKTAWNFDQSTSECRDVKLRMNFFVFALHARNLRIR